MAKGTVEIDEQRCKGCGICVVTCPKDVLDIGKQVNHRGYHFSILKNEENCIGCTNCAVVCPDGVITVYREKTAKA